jgi:hypothetical protein
MLKCLLIRRSAILKAKEKSALTSKIVNRKKQIYRNKEMYNLKLSKNNKKRLQECHSLFNFSKQNNMLNPTLKINSENVYPSTHNKYTLDQIKANAFNIKRSSNKEVGLNHLNPGSMANRRMTTIPVFAPKEGKS